MQSNRNAAVATTSLRELRRLSRLEVNRSQVLDIAEQVFAELGYEHSSVKAIAERCEFSVGSIYGLFADKEELFREVVSRRGREMEEILRDGVAGTDPADERLLRLAERQVSLYRDYPYWARIMTSFVTPGARSALPGGAVAAGYDRSYCKAMDVQATLIAQGQRDGLLRDGDPQALARIFSALVSMHHVIEEEAERVPMALGVDELTDLIRRALVQPGVRPSGRSR